MYRIVFPVSYGMGRNDREFEVGQMQIRIYIGWLKQGPNVVRKELLNWINHKGKKYTKNHHH